MRHWEFIGWPTQLDGTPVATSGRYARLNGAATDGVDPNFRPYVPADMHTPRSHVGVEGDGRSAKQKGFERRCRIRWKERITSKAEARRAELDDLINTFIGNGNIQHERDEADSDEEFWTSIGNAPVPSFQNVDQKALARVEC